MPRQYVVYDSNELRRMDRNQLATALNFRNGVTGEGALYRNSYGEFFLVRIDSLGLSMWDVGGRISLGSIDAKGVEAMSVSQIIDFIELRTNEWTCGIVYCADCGTRMRRFSDRRLGSVEANGVKVVGGRYFAALYCTSCWDRKWRDIEARETYG